MLPKASDALPQALAITSTGPAPGWPEPVVAAGAEGEELAAAGAPFIVMRCCISRFSRASCSLAWITFWISVRSSRLLAATVARVSAAVSSSAPAVAGKGTAAIGAAAGGAAAHEENADHARQRENPEDGDEFVSWNSHVYHLQAGLEGALADQVDGRGVGVAAGGAEPAVLGRRRNPAAAHALQRHLQREARFVGDANGRDVQRAALPLADRGCIDIGAAQRAGTGSVLTATCMTPGAALASRRGAYSWRAAWRVSCTMSMPAPAAADVTSSAERGDGLGTLEGSMTDTCSSPLEEVARAGLSATATRSMGICWPLSTSSATMRMGTKGTRAVT